MERETVAVSENGGLQSHVAREAHDRAATALLAHLDGHPEKPRRLRSKRLSTRTAGDESLVGNVDARTTPANPITEA